MTTVPTFPMFREGELIEDKHGNIFKILEVDDINDSDTCMHYNLELVTKARNSLDRPIGAHLKFKQPGDSFWVYDTEEAAKDDHVKVNDDHLFATELKLYEADKVEEIVTPMFNKGDVVKDKFGNLYVIEDLVSPQQLEQDSPEYDHMGYRLKIIEKNTSSPSRKVGNVSGFYSDGACMWIYNTFGDAVNDEVLVTDAHIFATELEWYDELDADDVEDIEVSDVPIFLVGDLVKDKFGNTFKVVDADKFEDFSDDCMHYNVELVIKHPDSPIRKAGGAAEFEKAGYYFWIYDTAEDAASRGVIVNDRQLLATELVLVQSVLQTKSTKTSKTGKSKIQKPAKPAKAEISKRYPSIEDLQNISEENDLGNLLDQAYEILKEQARFGNQIADLNFEKFKRCIPHFEREGFNVVENGQVIEIGW